MIGYYNLIYIIPPWTSVTAHSLPTKYRVQCTYVHVKIHLFQCSMHKCFYTYIYTSVQYRRCSFAMHAKLHCFIFILDHILMVYNGYFTSTSYISLGALVTRYTCRVCTSALFRCGLCWTCCATVYWNIPCDVLVISGLINR